MPAHAITEVTLVLGPPVHDSSRFADFQSLATLGDVVVDHTWATHEHEAVRALTAREGTIAGHTLLETLVGGVLGVPVIIADLAPHWVRYEDGCLYAAVTFNTEDVRPRAAAVALHTAEALEALNRVAGSLSTLDGREWLAWSSRTWHDDAERAGSDILARTTRLMATIAATVLDGDGTSIRDDEPSHETPRHDADAGVVNLATELQRAIALGRAHAAAATHPLAEQLRELRVHDPLRVEWQLVSMDAFFLAAQSPERVREQLPADETNALTYLYIGRDRTARLKADPYITPRFRRELAARAYMTAFALERLAPVPSRDLLELMANA